MRFIRAQNSIFVKFKMVTYQKNYCMITLSKNSIDNCKKLSLRHSVKVRPIKQQRSFCYDRR